MNNVINIEFTSMKRIISLKIVYQKLEQANLVQSSEICRSSLFIVDSGDMFISLFIKVFKLNDTLKY